MYDKRISMNHDDVTRKSSNQQEYRKLARDLRQFYFGDAKIDEHVNEMYLDMLNDKTFYYDIQKSVKYHVQMSKGNTYYFQ